MIKYCLDNGIITHDNIKNEINSSLTIPSNYCNEFVEHCFKHIDDYNVICEKLSNTTGERKYFKKIIYFWNDRKF